MPKPVLSVLVYCRETQTWTRLHGKAEVNKLLQLRVGSPEFKRRPKVRWVEYMADTPEDVRELKQIFNLLGEAGVKEADRQTEEMRRWRKRRRWWRRKVEPEIT